MGGRSAVALAVVLVGCLQSGLVPCGELSCPVGTQCVAGELCATPGQLSACADLVDGDTCSYAGGLGVCDRGVCIGTQCGNSVVDLDELCDDGNTVSGDGCRADCRKAEVCGDAVADQGEACDDGNVNPADGCDACIATVWRATALVGGQPNATAIGLAFPEAVTVDRDGNLYIADSGNFSVRRLDRNGVITTIAGSGSEGYPIAPDGARAATVDLYVPMGVALDSAGNLYIAHGDFVSKVDLDGVFTTVAGAETAASLGDGGAATAASLYSARGVTVDGLGNLYIADHGHGRIRRVDTAGVITTYAGGGATLGDGGPATSALLAPEQIVLDASGNLYVADANYSRVRRISNTGVISTIAGTGTAGYSGDGGPATAAQLRNPVGVALDAAGNLYVSEANHRVRKIDTSGIITTVAGTGTQLFDTGFSGDGMAATSAMLKYPRGIAVSGTDVYFSDAGNNRIRRISAGVITTVAGSGSYGQTGSGGAATTAHFYYPFGVVGDAAGNVYVVDTENLLIRKIDPSGVLTTIAGNGTEGFTGDGGPATEAQMRYPYGIAVDGAGNVYIADTGNNVIRKIDANGIITKIAGSPTGLAGSTGDGGPATSALLSSPFGVTIRGQNIYIADTGNSRVRRVDATGTITTVAGNGTRALAGDGGQATSASLAIPYAVAVDSSGQLYIADTGNSRVRRVAVDGVITTVAGGGTSGPGEGGPATSAQLYDPYGVAVDANGGFYVVDDVAQTVRYVSSAGVITTTAGTGNAGFSGDGGAATQAEMWNPSGIALDSAGRLMILDQFNFMLRRISATGIITTIAGGLDPEGMGPVTRAHLADARALAHGGTLQLIAGGRSGTVQTVRAGQVSVVAGRYPQIAATANLARFRSSAFGSVTGLAYDEAGKRIYISEGSANRLHVVHVTDPADETTWTIEPLANTAGTAGFANGAATTARFRSPSGLFLDGTKLYVADTGNHVIRAIELGSGIASATVITVAGIPATRGYFGDAMPATVALLFEPQAIMRCGGDLFIADTGNNRIRRIAPDGLITTVLGDGVAASSGDGSPASVFPVHAPSGLACDAAQNLFVTSTTSVRLLSANASGIVDGTGPVQTIYGAFPRTTAPASLTACVTGIAVVDATTIDVVDACNGLLVELRREVAPAP